MARQLELIPLKFDRTHGIASDIARKWADTDRRLFAFGQLSRLSATRAQIGQLGRGHVHGQPGRGPGFDPLASGRGEYVAGRPHS
jgi:hypothetical protein